MQFSIAAKLAAAALVALALVAFGWHEYRAGYASGEASVQQKWDKQTAVVSQAQTAQIAASASDALANYRAAGVVSAAAEQHQSDVASVHQQLTQRVQTYAQNHASTVQVQPTGVCPDAVLSDDGLRIWNDANAGIGNSSGQASDHPPIVASGVSSSTTSGE